MGIIFAIYILADKEHLNYIYHRLLRAIFKDSIRERIEYIVRKIDRAFGGFISGQLIEACILGSLCFVGLTIVGLFVGGMPYALLISVLVGATSIIPILGAYLSAIPSALLILLIDPVKALIFIIFLVVLQQFEGNVIYPRVVGGSIGERLYESKVYFQTADLLAWTVVIVVCSVGFEKLVLWLLRRCFAAWEGR